MNRPSLFAVGWNLVLLVAMPVDLAPADCPPRGGETGELRIRFEYGGQPVKPKLIQPDRDQAFCGHVGLVEERLLVHGENKGIQNVVVYLYTGRRGGTPLKAEEIPSAEPKTHVLDRIGCRYRPRVVATRVGDTLRITNRDDVGHNANINFVSNPPRGFTIPAGADDDRQLARAEPAPVPIDCNIHPWMRAWLLVLDHPFVGVSDENGQVVIPGLPTRKLVFRVFHEAGAVTEVVPHGGQPVAWRRALFEVEIEPGLNDQGTVIVPEAALKLE